MTKKRIVLIIFSIISGLAFAAFLLYDQRGTIGQTEIIALSVTAVIAITISLIIIQRANK
jgi:hypothetical protein